jgi:hypothetical protein
MALYKTALLRSLGTLAFIWLMMNLIGPGWLTLYRIADTGQLALATITAIDPGNHQGCSFEYTVNGVPHRGHGTGCSPRGIGADLQVTYAPIDPTYATTENAGQELLNQVFVPVFMALFVGGISAIPVRRPIAG